ncbi:MAG: MoaD/ThiS family protein [Methanolinea sp.]|jgi:molybdopterin synthase sulfur carrier subunit|nr:MoaD/ThiS family protein [Methanolinea sp.]
MIKVHIRSFARFRELFGDRFEVEVCQPATIRSVVQAVGQRNRDGLQELMDGEGKVKRSVILLINRERITGEGRENHPVAEGDEVAIYPPVAGG